jgi:hypothetical protein
MKRKAKPVWISSTPTPPRFLSYFPHSNSMLAKESTVERFPRKAKAEAHPEALFFCVFMRKMKRTGIYTCMNHTNLFLLGDVARLLSCRPHQVTYLLSSRQVQEPALRIGGRRLFTDADIETIKQHLKKGAK